MGGSGVQHNKASPVEFAAPVAVCGRGWGIGTKVSFVIMNMGYDDMG